ncbi:MAG: helix-turn-helix transcriptional regulator [Saprospiraceae bacterium]|nr:helix-turn-helix transcriptional regulator [Saprospiraceae bacterium]
MTTPSDPDVFLALADPHRREILRVLTGQPASINAIADRFTISRPAISKHIKLLEASGFIRISPQGRERICHLDDSGFDQVRAWMDYFEAYWHTQFMQLDNYLKSHPDESV